MSVNVPGNGAEGGGEPERKEPGSTDEFREAKVSPDDSTKEYKPQGEGEAEDASIEATRESVAAEARQITDVAMAAGEKQKSAEVATSTMLMEFTRLCGLLVEALGTHRANAVTSAIGRIQKAESTNDVRKIGEQLVAQGFMSLPQMLPIVEKADHPEQHPLVGNCQLLCPLGKGGMGEVHLAYHEGVGQPRAIKFLPEDAAPQAAARFTQEIQSAADINHDNVIQVYDAGKATLQGRERHYYTMEYAPGMDYDVVLKTYGPLPVQEACDAGTHAARGLLALHRHTPKLIHRDIKPKNMLYTVDAQGRGVLKLVDFGLVRVGAQPEEGVERPAGSEESPSASTIHTQVGTIVGSLPYMSPEQLRGEEQIDEKTDVYSLGVTLYELLTGELPYRGRSPSDYQQLFCDPKIIIPTLPDHVPPGLAKFITRKMMAVDAAERPTTRYVQDVLEKYGKHPRGTWRDRALRLARRCSPRRILRAWRARGKKKLEALEGQKIDLRAVPLEKYEQSILAAIPKPHTMTVQPVVTDPFIRALAPADADALALTDTAKLAREQALIAPDAEKIRRSLFPYRLRRIIGIGAMGTVYDAVSEAGERFAIKVMRPDLVDDASRTALFLREGEVEAMFADANVSMPVKVRDRGILSHPKIARPMPYIVMDYIDGGTLANIHKEHAFTCEQVIAIGHQLLHGLAKEVHPHYVIHRDIKPSNVMLEHGRVRLTDFGLASLRFTETLSDAHTAFVGSPAYAAPEILQQGPSATSPQCDIYSAGCTLYELLAGHQPCPVKEQEKLPMFIQRVLHTPLPELPRDAEESIGPLYAERLRSILHRMLAKDPKERYASAEECAADLAVLLEDIRRSAALPKTVRQESP